MSAHDPLPLTILGGYLGAGKTTVLNHLLRHAQGRRIAVVVNDFGAINIDADLIENQTADTLSISGGCVCCSFGDDLQQTLLSLQTRAHLFDHIVIETSGVTLPRNLRAAISLIPGVSVAGTIVVVDAERVREQAADRHVGDAVIDQLRSADLLLLSKCDLVDDDALAGLQTWLKDQSRAPILQIVQGELPLSVMLGEFERRPHGGGRSAHSPSAGPSSQQSPQTDRPLRAAGHLLTRYHTAFIELPETLDPHQVARTLAELNPPLLRAKGFIRGPDDALVSLQVVGHRATISPAPSQVAGTGRLVMIRADLPMDTHQVHAAILRAQSLTSP